MRIKGIVVKGKQKGRALGFPTANLALEGGLGVKSGVYAGQVYFSGQSHKSAIFINKNGIILEAYILDFNGDLYDKEIEIEIGNKIREVMKFGDDKKLMEQIKLDISRITQIYTQKNAETQTGRSRLTQIKTQKNAETQKDEFLYSDITYQIRGACFEVYKQFGGAFKEKVIENALLEELKNRGLKVETQKRIDIYFKDKKVGTYVPDIIVNDVVLVELKCKPFITKEDERQFWLYLKGSEYKLGLLINFGSQRLEIRRRIYDSARNYKQNDAEQDADIRRS